MKRGTSSGVPVEGAENALRIAGHDCRSPGCLLRSRLAGARTGGGRGRGPLRRADQLNGFTHQLKGTGSSFGFESLSELSKDVESSLKKLEFELATEKYACLDARLLQVIGGYDEWIKNKY